MKFLNISIDAMSADEGLPSLSVSKRYHGVLVRHFFSDFAARESRPPTCASREFLQILASLLHFAQDLAYVNEELQGTSARGLRPGNPVPGAHERHA